ncbi:hypothetical protein [Polaromonas sp. LjRoot131]|uniref:hypothetical protein n=1 Tax=Polaromonas sp. LjRoot131 TaxID=3342262 RepID=UPI003ECED277
MKYPQRSEKKAKATMRDSGQDLGHKLTGKKATRGIKNGYPGVMGIAIPIFGRMSYSVWLP